MATPMRVLLHNDETEALEAAIGSRFPAIELATCHSYAELPGVLSRLRPEVVYSVRFDGTPDFPRAALFGTHGPRWISNGGVGTDHFGHWDPDAVTITNAAGVAADMMAEYVFGGFLHFTLDVPGLVADKARKHWAPRKVRPLKGQTLLIVGLGQTGHAIARRARAFGMKVLATRANPVESDVVDEVHSADALSRVLPRADFIVVATPLIDRTRGLLGQAEFAAMKDGVILADVSRGGVVDQSALLAALERGKVGGAVLDVFEVEPLPKGSPLWTQDNVVISPHCSSVYDGWEMASFEMFLDNLQRWIDGTPLCNVVDPVRGY